MAPTLHPRINSASGHRTSTLLVQQVKMERPVTPPDQVLRPNLTTPPPAPHRKRAVPRISGDIKDLPPPSYEANFNKPPDFEVPPLSGGDFQEFPNEEEWADKLGLK